MQLTMEVTKQDQTPTHMHCTESLKPIFPEMKMWGPRSQFLYSCIWKRFIYSHDRIGSNLESPFFLYCVRELLAWPQMSGEGQGTAAKQWLSAVPCPPLRSCSCAESSHIWPTYKFPIWKITDHKGKQLILVVYYLFSLRVNEIPNKTFILDSHWPFICIVISFSHVGACIFVYKLVLAKVHIQ